MKKIFYTLFILIISGCLFAGDYPLQYMVRMTVFQTYTQEKGDKRFDIVVTDQVFACPSPDNWKSDKFTTGPKAIGEYKSTGFKIEYNVEWDITGYDVKAYWKIGDAYKGEITWLKEMPLKDKTSPFKINETIKLNPNTLYTNELGILGIDN
jgi:hypothetical protein